MMGFSETKYLVLVVRILVGKVHFVLNTKPVEFDSAYCSIFSIDRKSFYYYLGRLCVQNCLH